jgi:predicted nuclease with TOPRIM domain
MDNNQANQEEKIRLQQEVSRLKDELKKLDELKELRQRAAYAFEALNNASPNKTGPNQQG